MAGSFEISDLARHTGMDGIIRFRDLGDCLFLLDGDMLKLFRPSSVRRLGGLPGDRYMSGGIGFAVRAQITDLAPARKRVLVPPSLTLCPLMNFRHIPIVDIVDGSVPTEFSIALVRHLRAIPCSLSEMEAAFGNDFLDRPRLDRLSILVDYLRALPADQTSH
jgi:hypothetical protein